MDVRTGHRSEHSKATLLVYSLSRRIAGISGADRTLRFASPVCNLNGSENVGWHILKWLLSTDPIS